MRGVAALAPASDLPTIVKHVDDVTGGSIFASYAFAAYSAIEPDVTYDRYVRPGAQTFVRSMAQRCLTDPDMALSILAVLGTTQDPDVFAEDPTTGPLGAALRANAAPTLIGPPVLVGQGAADSIVLPSVQDDFVARMCEAGQRVDYRRYAGFQHAQVMEGYSPLTADLLEWTRGRFAATDAGLGCTVTEK